MSARRRRHRRSRATPGRRGIRVAAPGVSRCSRRHACRGCCCSLGVLRRSSSSSSLVPVIASGLIVDDGAAPGVHRRLSRRGMDAGARRTPPIRHLLRGFRANLGALHAARRRSCVARHAARRARDVPGRRRRLLDCSRRRDRCRSSASPPTRRSPTPSVQIGMLASIACALPIVARRCGSRRRSSCSRTAAPRARWRRASRAALANWRPLARLRAGGRRCYGARVARRWASR